MAFNNGTGSGAQTNASAQVAQRYVDIEPTAGNTVSTERLRVRGCPRVLIWVRQDAGAVAGELLVETSISDTDIGAPEWLPLGVPTILPPTVPITLELVIPGKFLRLSVTAPAGNSVRVNAAIMVAQ